MPTRGRSSSEHGKPRRSTSRRSPGTRLTDEQKRQIIALIEAGATDHAAAESAGISARTLREIRQRAEDRHLTRGSTPELRQFVTDMDQAIARARIKREVVVADTDPKYWLKNRARSKPGLDGWTEPVPEEPDAQDPIHIVSPEELQQIVLTLVSSGAVELPPCADPSCSCSHHGAGLMGGEADEAR